MVAAGFKEKEPGKGTWESEADASPKYALGFFGGADFSL